MAIQLMNTKFLPLAVVIAAALPAQNATDVVRKRKAGPDGGVEVVKAIEIKEFTRAGVKFAAGANETVVPPHQVVEVEWGNPPDAFVSGHAALERGDFATAVQMFGEAQQQTERALLKVDAQFFQLKAAVAGTSTDKAAAATAAASGQAWLGANSTHFRIPEAMLLTGRAQRLAGNATDAAAMLRDLDDRATRDDFGPIWSARAKFELALTLAAEGKAGEARAQFQSATASADTALANPGGADAELRLLKTQAKVGEGETFLGEKEYAKAEAFFRSLASSDQPTLVAAGRAGEGEAIFLAAADAKQPEQLRRAQLALATASVLDTTSGEASAKANYYLGRCLLELGVDREGDSFRSRANAYFQIVATNYPTSPWAAASRAMLAK
jgi:outer membrane protein assembly factor BamD (BamD/ComL family)